MTTTLGRLVSDLMRAFEHELHDHELAALATEVALNEILTKRAQARMPARRSTPS